MGLKVCTCVCWQRLLVKLCDQSLMLTHDASHIKQCWKVSCLSCFKMSCNKWCGLMFIISIGDICVWVWCMCARVLTDVWDVKREPVEESVADQLGKEQTERELHHSLQDRTQTPLTPARGTFWGFFCGTNEAGNLAAHSTVKRLKNWHSSVCV